MHYIVFIPAYNAEEWITRCLKSVLDQDHTNFEVLCIDDASTDNTGSIMEAMRPAFEA
jgi:glycosyltransferase involved in cell wall biosynthesis